MGAQLSQPSPTLRGMGDKSAAATAVPPPAASAGPGADPDAGSPEPTATPAGPQAGADAGPAGPAGPSLSPSRAGDFLTCPLLYRFRVIDRLPEPPSPAAARGTLVHAVLERLFDNPPAERTPPAAHSLVQPEWSRLLEAEPELATLFEGAEEQRAAAGVRPAAGWSNRCSSTACTSVPRTAAGLGGSGSRSMTRNR